MKGVAEDKELSHYRLMTATYESIMDAAMKLTPGDRCRAAATLWESVGEPYQDPSEDELERLLDQREAEMDADASQEISHQDFMAHFSARRPL
jgi:putative addiction module component (TIGR02574 family)